MADTTGYDEWWDALSEQKRDALTGKVRAGEDLTPDDVYGTTGHQYLYVYTQVTNTTGPGIMKILRGDVQDFVERKAGL